jgi:hypothetical protein
MHAARIHKVRVAPANNFSTQQRMRSGLRHLPSEGAFTSPNHQRLEEPGIAISLGIRDRCGKPSLKVQDVVSRRDSGEEHEKICNWLG